MFVKIAESLLAKTLTKINCKWHLILIILLKYVTKTTYGFNANKPKIKKNAVKISKKENHIILQIKWKHPIGPRSTARLLTEI